MIVALSLRPCDRAHRRGSIGRASSGIYETLATCYQKYRKLQQQQLLSGSRASPATTHSLFLVMLAFNKLFEVSMQKTSLVVIILGGGMSIYVPGFPLVRGTSFTQSQISSTNLHLKYFLYFISQPYTSKVSLIYVFQAYHYVQL